MAQAGTPNPIELYEGARDYMIPNIGGVQASQLTGSTPCTNWNVKQLINHNLLVAEMVHRTFTGGEPVGPLCRRWGPARRRSSGSLCGRD